jgi:xanthine/CO dehydrogenase XdhC/CoxF family maturation factor
MNTVPEARLDTGLETLLENAPRDASPRVLATVVGTAGSTYRKPGARMLMLADGSYLGLLSGGCLEADLGLHARAVLESGIARAIEYDMRGPDDILFGIGAGCEGAMRVLLEPAGPEAVGAASLREAARSTREGCPTVLVSVHESGALALGTYCASAAALPAAVRAAARESLATHAARAVDCLESGLRCRAFVQYLAPPPHLLVCGGGPDAQPVVAAALALGWRVSVVDHRPAYAAPARFPGARVTHIDARQLRLGLDLHQCHAAVVMSHHLASDVAYLKELSAASLPAYVGLLGPAARRRRIAEELGAAAAPLSARLHSPVGLDIGAVTPEGIALAIVSQIHAFLARRGHDAEERTSALCGP